MVENSDKTVSDESDRITTWGYSSFIVTLTKSGFLGMSSYIIFSLSNINAYISVIAGSLIGIIPLLMFIFIGKHSEDKDIVDLNNSLFGKKIGFILNLVLNATILFMAILALYNISQFIDIQYMPDTDTNYLRIIVLIPIVYAASKNITVISKISQMILFINLGIFFVTVLGFVSECNIENMFPVLKDGINTTILSSGIYAIFATFPIFLLLIIPQNKVQQEKHKTRKIFFMYAVANVTLTIIVFMTVLILGEELLPVFRYPEYIALKRFSLFTLIERVENTLSLQFLFNSIIYLIVSFHFLIQGLKKIFKNNQRENLFPYIIAIVVLVASNFLFQDAIKSAEFIKSVVPYIILLGILAPMVLTFLAQVVRMIKNRKSNVGT